jgi:hypothetical protein
LLPATHAEPARLLIGVRSGIDQAEKDKRDHDAQYAADPAKRLRLFLLARVSEEEAGSYEKLLKPVNARVLAEQVTKQLVSQGFRPVGPNQKPELIITVKYGRGQLMSNPYLDLDNLPPTDPRKVGQHSNLSDSDRVGVQAHPNYVGLEEKRQRLKYEQLIIQVRAWKYPPPIDPKQKEELLWMTTMYVDDPDHTDLNAVAEKLLAAGAPYFDRHVEREKEAVIDTSLPEGRVNVGTPEVIKSANPK